MDKRRDRGGDALETPDGKQRRDLNGLRVDIFEDRHNRRSRTVCEAASIGFKRLGAEVERYHFRHPPDYPKGDVAFMYGIGFPRDEIMDSYRRLGKHGILVDLGYWERRRGGRYHGFHKVVVDEIHPIEMIRTIGPRPATRLDDLCIDVLPYHEGDEIIVAGMSAKSAATHGVAPEAWELAAIKRLREVTDKTIIYRPKPSWDGARPLPGAEFADGNLETIEDALKRAHAVVTHHSNVGVDAVIAGVRLYTETGAAKAMSLDDISDVVTGQPPAEPIRMSWMRALTYCQWTIQEMKLGKPWSFFAEAGLLA